MYEWRRLQWKEYVLQQLATLTIEVSKFAFLLIYSALKIKPNSRWTSLKLAIIKLLILPKTTLTKQALLSFPFSQYETGARPGK